MYSGNLQQPRMSPPAGGMPRSGGKGIPSQMPTPQAPGMQQRPAGMAAPASMPAPRAPAMPRPMGGPPVGRPAMFAQALRQGISNA